jgi:hypothetical protein
MHIQNHHDNNRGLFLFLITTFVILYTEFFSHLFLCCCKFPLIEGLEIREHSSSF